VSILDAALRLVVPSRRAPGGRVADSRPVLPVSPKLVLEPGAVRVRLDFLDGGGQPEDGTIGYPPPSIGGPGGGGAGGGGPGEGAGLALGELADVSAPSPTAHEFLTATQQEGSYRMRPLELGDLPNAGIEDAIGLTVLNPTNGTIPLRAPFQAQILNVNHWVDGGSASVTTSKTGGDAIGASGEITVTLSGVSDPPPDSVVVLIRTRRLA